MSLFNDSNAPSSWAVNNTSVTVNATATSVISTNGNRKGLVIKNTGLKAVYVGFSNAVSMTNYFQIINIGATYEFPYNFCGEVFAVTTLGTNTVSVYEFL